MKKSILTIGHALKKDEQKQINGGFGSSGCLGITDEVECDNTFGCNWAGCYCASHKPHIPPC